MKQLGQYAAPRHVVAHLSDPHLIGGGARHYGVSTTTPISASPSTGSRP